MTVSSYPLHVDADQDAHLSRWLWLVKWVLVIPHYFLLVFLWVAFLALSVAAFFAILFTGRYPRTIFEFNVGVLRWSWRVAYYAYGALGTDRYPPFTLAEVPDYPAHLSVDYPEHLSRGLVLVKWWLLAIPHYLIVAILAGGGIYWTTEAAGGDGQVQWGGGLIGLLVLIAGVILLFTGRYPRPLFDFILGLNRWVLRVAAYAGLMTDDYPPFRFDSGPHEPGAGVTTATRGAPPPPAGIGYQGPASSATAPASAEGWPGQAPPDQEPGGPAPGGQAPGSQPPPATSTSTMHWTTGRVLALVFGILLTLFALGSGIGGATLALADNALRDDDGFLMTGDRPVATQTYAVVSEDIELHTDAPDFLPAGLLGDARMTAASEAGPVFVGVGPTSEVEAWLAGVPHTVSSGMDADGGWSDFRRVPGTAAPSDPDSQDFWVTSASGTGTQEITWALEDGTWTVVVMNADASRGLVADVAAGVTVPGLSWLVAVLLVIAAVALVIAIVLMVVAFRPQRTVPAPAPPTPPPGGSW